MSPVKRNVVGGVAAQLEEAACKRWSLRKRLETQIRAKKRLQHRRHSNPLARLGNVCQRVFAALRRHPFEPK